MPRESAASLTALRPPKKPARLVPPVGVLSAEESRLFATLVKENPHLRESDLPYLVAFCQANTRVTKAARDPEVLKWHRETQALIALGRTCRLTQRSVHDPKELARRMRNGKHDRAMAQLLEMNGDTTPHKPWELDEHDDAS
jgi:hypothetical protein